MNKAYDVIIIGAGPAGISTAIQLKRYGISFLLLEKNDIGGLLKNASLVENFPGFAKGITGCNLINLFQKHLSHLNIEIKKEEVKNINYKNNVYSVLTKNNYYTSKFLVVATGTKRKEFFLKDSSFAGIYYEVCNLRNVRNKNIVIIGGGDAAFDYAVSLGKGKNDISIILRGSKPSCIPALFEKVSKKKNISYFCNLKIEKILKEEKKIVIKCLNKINSNEKNFKADYLIAAIGREPQLDFLNNHIKEKIKLLSGNSLFFVGDVKNEIFRQATISIGDGISTAMKISKKLKNENENNS